MKKPAEWLPAKPFVPYPPGLVASAAMQSLGINDRRLIDFLVNEHQKHGLRKNGQLMAPRRQLIEFGIGARHITGAIENVVRSGLVDVIRGTRRVANRYALTWMPLAGASEPTDRWRDYQY